MGEDILLDKIEHQEGLIWLKINKQNMLYDLLSQGFKNVFACCNLVIMSPTCCI